MCINSVKETCFSQKYQKWIYQVLEINSSIIHVVLWDDYETNLYFIFVRTAEWKIEWKCQHSLGIAHKYFKKLTVLCRNLCDRNTQLLINPSVESQKGVKYCLKTCSFLNQKGVITVNSACIAILILNRTSLNSLSTLLTLNWWIILPTVYTLIRHRGHYNAWKLSTWSFPVCIEMLRLMNKMSAKILNFWILKILKMQPNVSINHDGIFKNIFYTQTQGLL